jgi:hypothetical protein
MDACSDTRWRDGLRRGDGGVSTSEPSVSPRTAHSRNAVLDLTLSAHYCFSRTHYVERYSRYMLGMLLGVSARVGWWVDEKAFLLEQPTFHRI